MITQEEIDRLCATRDAAVDALRAHLAALAEYGSARGDNSALAMEGYVCVSIAVLLDGRQDIARMAFEGTKPAVLRALATEPAELSN